MINILFVCTGNTCRSPIAEALMDDAVDRSRSLHGEVKTKSAGTFVCEGEEATPKAKSMMEELGADVRLGTLDTSSLTDEEKASLSYGVVIDTSPVLGSAYTQEEVSYIILYYY
ncbi:MAG: hypothetical protein RR777_05175 [Christensenellaceae bacterium]